MDELKCPWQTVTKNVSKNGDITSYALFADCVKGQCPFWEKGRETHFGTRIPGQCTRVGGKNNG